MKKSLAAAAIVASFALIGSPVHAQAPAPAAAPAAAVDPASLAASRELFEAMNYRATMTGMLQQMSQGIAQSIRASYEASIHNNPKLSAEQKKDALAKMENDLLRVVGAVQGAMNDPGMMDEILAETIPLYARTFSADELKQIAAFYRTPVGARMLAAIPQLTGQGMQIGQQIVTRRLGPVMRKLDQENQK